MILIICLSRTFSYVFKIFTSLHQLPIYLRRACTNTNISTASLSMNTNMNHIHKNKKIHCTYFDIKQLQPVWRLERITTFCLITKAFRVMLDICPPAHLMRFGLYIDENLCAHL